jgi:hypothetical protein
MTDTNKTDGKPLTGHCLCRAIHIEITDPQGPAIACHCTQCRRQSGNYIVSTYHPIETVKITGAQHLTWFHSSPDRPRIRRGFCATCGSNMFWENEDGWISVNLGCLDTPTGLTTAYHIFYADKGDYYEIVDGLPQYAKDDYPKRQD